ncbi:DUF6932 family protein [Vandammella animalimorsus]|uniref:Uncharacterized protein n=1 Tax=Vandammella animalimorsus TaxID=2029117 RepID=A0A2A2ACJ0_9BURK|nr:hypothetical protein [Vandammella animalimorsus]PAT35319.1 hypothetical protein CK620_05425 [Vandammella animalimorsus]
MTANKASIPYWDNEGLLPPIHPDVSGNNPNRSPYAMDLSMFIDRFATSPERIDILDGLLRFRSDLHAAGINSGFQWLDGSFLENIEILEDRPPNDIDVVTFFYLPQKQTQASLFHRYPYLFDPAQTKQLYAVDAYPFVLGETTAHHHVKMIAYWYSMWSHRRDGRWKGFVQVDLNPTKDIDARTILSLAGGLHHG